MVVVEIPTIVSNPLLSMYNCDANSPAMLSIYLFISLRIIASQLTKYNASILYNIKMHSTHNF